MSSRIIIPDVGGRTADTTPPASAYDLDTKIRAALAAGVFVAVGLTVLMWAVLAVIQEFGGRPPWKVWAATLGLAFFIGLAVACWYGVDWSIRVAKRPWDVDDDERAYQRGLAKKAREEQEEAAKRAKENIRSGPMDHDWDPDTLTLEQELYLVAHAMLMRACLGHGKPTREEMVEDGVCTQAQWNTINEAMQKIGLRKGYTWQPVPFDEAWDTFRANFRVRENEYGEIEAWALKPGSSWKVVERVG